MFPKEMVTSLQKLETGFQKLQTGFQKLQTGFQKLETGLCISNWKHVRIVKKEYVVFNLD